MPTYEYKCENCEHFFEEFQSIIAKPLRKCPQCKKMKLNRLIGTGAAVIFKGSGFYQTDYRTDSYTQGKSAEKNASKAKTDTKKSETKKESKKPGKKKTT